MNKKIAMAFGAMSLASIIGFTSFQSGIVNAEPKLTKQDVREMITAQYPGVITELELEKEDKQVYYEVEVELEDREYELKVNADTGEVLKLEEKYIPIKVAEEKKVENTVVNQSEVPKQVEEKKPNEVVDTPKIVAPQQQQVTPKQQVAPNQKQTVISVEEAKRIALANFAGTIEELELDEDDGRLIYEIEIENGNREAEIEIDAYTGKVIMLEIETDDDDD